MKTIRTCIKCGIQVKKHKTNSYKYCESCWEKHLLEYQKKYHQKHGKEYREKHKEKLRQKSKKYYIENIEKMTKYNREYFKSKEGKQKSKKYYQENKKKMKNRSMEYNRNLKKEIIKEYGGKCTCCGEDTPEFLSIDHINNNGKEHREKIGSGNSLYRWLRKLNYPKNNYQLLCFNCNMAKGFFGICPHQKNKTPN